MVNDKKIFWFDTETTGTNPKEHGIVQLAVLLEVNNKIEDTFHAKMCILPGKKVEQEALNVTGFTMDQVMSDFEDPLSVYIDLNKFLGRHGTGFKEDRFIMAGYNSNFDCDFLDQWYQSISRTKWAYWKYLQHSPIDVLPTLRAMRYAGLIDIKDTKLETACEYFGIPITAHDALSDITATRELTTMIYSRLWTLWHNAPHGLLRPLTPDEMLEVAKEKTVDE